MGILAAFLINYLLFLGLHDAVCLLMFSNIKGIEKRKKKCRYWLYFLISDDFYRELDAAGF